MSLPLSFVALFQTKWFFSRPDATLLTARIECQPRERGGLTKVIGDGVPPTGLEQPCCPQGKSPTTMLVRYRETTDFDCHRVERTSLRAGVQPPSPAPV